jgi:hypothetical protein
MRERPVTPQHPPSTKLTKPTTTTMSDDNFPQLYSMVEKLWSLTRSRCKVGSPVVTLDLMEAMSSRVLGRVNGSVG